MLYYLGTGTTLRLSLPFDCLGLFVIALCSASEFSGVRADGCLGRFGSSRVSSSNNRLNNFGTLFLHGGQCVFK
jgi:hypothetical protein